MDAKNKLAIWAQEFLERQIFMKLGGVSTLTCTDQTGSIYAARATWSNTPDAIPSTAETSSSMAWMYTSRYLCADKTGGLNGIAATDILTTSLISQVKTIAELVNPQIRPLRVDGQNCYVMFVHPKQALDLRTSASTTSNTWSQAQREAQVRGDKNPIFSGALGVWDNVILFSHEYVPTVLGPATYSVSGTAVASTVRAYRALLCGRQAAVAAFTTDSFNMVEKAFDYENQVGYATGIIGGIQKTQFNSRNYGVVTLDTGATQ
jgi:N4-gp56 family major capsid protein